MGWTDWLREGRVAEHSPGRAEIAAQRRAAERSLRDASLPNLSPEGRFQLAYGAALDLATIVILASGYRVKSRLGHHQLTFEAAGLGLGTQAATMVDFFDVCRRRRNVIAYEGDEVGEESSRELLRETTRFSSLVEAWLRTAHPELV